MSEARSSPASACSCATPGGSATPRTRPPTATRAPTPSGTPRAPSAVCRSRRSRRSGSGFLADIEGVAPRAETGVRARPRDRGLGRQGHDHRALGDDGHPARRAVPAVPERVPARGDRALRGGDRSAVLGNVPASGTEIIEELGGEHLATGRPIVYTSGDSVFQIATPRRRRAARRSSTGGAAIARGILIGPHRVGRVIARPFDGPPGASCAGPSAATTACRRRPARCSTSSSTRPSARARDRQDPGHLRSSRASPRRRYSDSNDHGVDLTIEALAGGRARRSCSRTSSTSIRSTATATIRPATRPRSRRSIGGSRT